MDSGRPRPAAPSCSGREPGGCTPRAWDSTSWRSPPPWARCALPRFLVQSVIVALDAGETTSVAAITFTLETVAPSLVGLALLGDGVRPNTQVLAVAGFVLTLGACIALAGRSEA